MILFWKEFPQIGNAPGSETSYGNYYVSSPEQSIYINQIKYIYELMNPTNYDMDLVIYDIVYKQDSLDKHCNNAFWESKTHQSNVLATPATYADNTNVYENPISFIITSS